MRLIESLPVLHPIDEGEGGDDETKDSHRDEVPLPALHKHEVKLDGIAIILESKREVEDRWVPILWRPRQSRIRNVVWVWLVLECRSELEVDALVVVLVGNNEDVDERGERVDGGDRRKVKPEVVDEGGEAVEFSMALELTVTKCKRDASAQADNDEC